MGYFLVDVILGLLRKSNWILLQMYESKLMWSHCHSKYGNLYRYTRYLYESNREYRRPGRVFSNAGRSKCYLFWVSISAFCLFIPWLTSWRLSWPKSHVNFCIRDPACSRESWTLIDGARSRLLGGYKIPVK